jgi:SOS response regulatory protein OraA/RecX
MKIYDIILENEAELSENAALKAFMKSALDPLVTNTIAGLRAINPGLADDLLKIASARNIKGVKNADELVNLLKSNRLSVQGIGDLMTGALKTSGVSDDFIRVVAPKWVDDPRFITAWASDPNKKLTKNALLAKGYSPNAADEIISYTKRSKKFQDALANLTKTTPNPPKPPKWKGGMDMVNKILGYISKGWTWAKILAVTGISGFALWYIITEFGNGETPEGMPEQQPSEWASCVQKIIDSGKGRVVTSTSGQVSVLAYDEEYPNGVKIYSNGRIMNVSTRQMGSWTCNNDEIQSVQENKKKLSLMSIIYEQYTDQMADDVETMIDLLDFPVFAENLNSAYVLLKKYVDSGNAKDFLDLYQKSGFGSGSIVKSLNNIKAFNSKTVIAKERFQKLVNQVVNGQTSGASSGSSSGSSSVSSNGLKDLNINWDGQNTATTEPVPDTTTEPDYIDCSEWDIETRPYVIGCRARNIQYIQQCLGDEPFDGIFDERLQKALAYSNIDTTGGITKVIFDEIMRRCNDNDEQQAPEQSPEQAPEQTPVETGTQDFSPQNETGSQFYLRLNKAGYFKRGEVGDRKIRYKDAALSKNDYDKLTQFFATYGYKPHLIKDIGDEEFKYVWIKRRR